MEQTPSQKQAQNTAGVIGQKATFAGVTYQVVNAMSSGGQGATVLLFDDTIQHFFVAKKFVPAKDANVQDAFVNFQREVSCLYKVNHRNIVRIFSHYLYPNIPAGYIIMERIEGEYIDKYLLGKPDELASLFEQAVEGFVHLEDVGIIHRDLKPSNLLVTVQGVLKIIDFGFGKEISESSQTASVAVNWPYTVPEDIALGIYDHQTDIYFLAQVFLTLISTLDLGDSFKYSRVLEGMGQFSRQRRLKTFKDVERMLKDKRSSLIQFSESERSVFATLSSTLDNVIDHFNNDRKFQYNLEAIIKRLEQCYTNYSASWELPDNAGFVYAFLPGGGFRYKTGTKIRLAYIEELINELRELDTKRGAAFLRQLYQLLEYKRKPVSNPDDDLPF